MKLKAPDAAAATARSPTNWFLGICLAALTIISTSAAANAQTGAEGLNPAEKWVVAQAMAGEVADLSQQFPAEKDRKLSAHFLEELLTGELPGVKLHRRGVRIVGAIITDKIDLKNAQIPCDVWLNDCQFMMEMGLVRANFAGNAVFNGSSFRAGANFGGVKAGHSALFHNTKFAGATTFALAEIAGNFEAQEAVFTGAVKFSGMKVRGSGFFHDAHFGAPVDLGLAEFVWLDLSSRFWPKDPRQFRMQGMSYKYVSAVAGNEAASHKALLHLADQSAYSADVYGNLEEFFLHQGYRADADRAFIAGKRRERKENLHGLGWLASLLLDGLVGYGRRPWQAGIPCAVLVALGCVLFSPKKMEPQKPDDAPRVYSRFWYSLGLFLPFVDLQADKVWKPKADQTFLRNYMRVHILLGWILVPLVLAALTGLIK